MVNPSVFWDSIEGWALSKSIDTAATVNKGLFGVSQLYTVSKVKVLPWVVDGAGGLGAGKTSGAGTRGVDLNAAIGGRTGDSNTNGGESSNNGSKIHVECYPAENHSL